jgi:hypothetical protein
MTTRSLAPYLQRFFAERLVASDQARSGGNITAIGALGRQRLSLMLPFCLAI